jgi:hypothetical protein
VISSSLSGERRILPDGVFALLDQLRSFRPLSEHAENALRRMGAAHGHDSDIRKTLEDLRRRG